MLWDPEANGVVVLPSGRRVRGRALRDGVDDSPTPDLGLYLTGHRHEEPWESLWVPWPDFRLPRMPTDAVAALRAAYERSGSERVELACGGGRGRTGTALAILARYDGVAAERAVKWVRSAYRAGAVETPWQRRFVREVPLAP